jgi:signal transduction histidine kinase
MISDLSRDVETVGRIASVPGILDVACRVTGMGFAAIARVTEDRWIACAVKDDIAFGLKPGGELRVETTICNEIRQHHQPVVIDHVDKEQQWRTHHTPLQYGFQSYISMPIVLPDGRFFGTLCSIDPRPNKLDTPEVRGMFVLFAELIAYHLDAADQLAGSEKRLAAERENAVLREQFIAVLGHDLRNPLSAIDAGTRMLVREPLTDSQASIVGLVRTSVSRMAGLISNVLDFARGRLGEGIALNRQTGDIAPTITQVVNEFHASAAGRQIETTLKLDEPVNCDQARIGQLLSNLLGNAISHGAQDKPVRINASSGERMFELSVANAGEPISPAAMERLFQPFARGELRPNQAGLGLGLFISAEIARAHGGELDVSSTPEETRFVLRIPQIQG